MVYKWIEYNFLAEIIYGWEKQITPEMDPNVYRACAIDEMYSNEILAYEFILPKSNCFLNSPK